MKKKISKIWGVGLTFVMVVSLMLIAAPGTAVVAAEPVINEWDTADFPDPGEDGDWFWDPGIDAVGPIAEAIDGTLYAYVDGPDNLFQSEDDGRTWAETDYADDLTGEGHIVDMVCSSFDADTLYVTDGNYVYKTDDAGDDWDFVADGSLENALMGASGTPVTGEPITGIDVGYRDEEPHVFISTTGGVTSVAATDTITITAGCALDLALNIDDAPITLLATDTAALIATAIAAAVTTNGTVTTAVAAANVVNFTARTAGTAANGALAMADAAYSGGTVPAVTMAGGVNGVAQVDTVTPTPANQQPYQLTIDATVFDYTTGTSATAEEIVAAFTALINADLVLAVTASGTTTLILTADATGTAFATSDTGTGVLTVVTTTAPVTAVAATGSTTVPAGVGALDVTVNIDGTAITLADGDAASVIAGKIAAGIFTNVTATADGADVTFTAVTPGAAGNGAVTMADAAYSGGTVPAITLTGGADIATGAGTVYYLDEEAYGTGWIDMELGYEYPGYYALSVGCAPDFEDSEETYVVISDGSETHVAYTDGTIGEWTEFAELCWDCVAANHFGSIAASRIAFPDDWEDTETLFVGVVDTDTCIDEDDPPDDQGGDVYSVTEDESLDRNVRPGEGGCEGESTDIISLDFCGDTDDGYAVAGAYCDTTVYYSSDGGWEWDPSIKHPTGEDTTYVLLSGDCGDSALAATAGCGAAVSLTCISEEEDAEDVGMSWNQISLIAMTIECVTDVDHSPGYVTDSSTLYLVISTDDGYECEDTHVFRNDGTYWDRVFSDTTYSADFQGTQQIQSVQVSPDFENTETVYVTNEDLDIFRSQDAGCSWERLGYPCDPTDVTSWAVLDEDTVYVGSDGVVLMTDRAGSRSWEECVVEDADSGVDADDIVYFDFNISDGAMTILVDDSDSSVFLCQVDPDEDWEDQEWHLVGDCDDVLDSGTAGTRPSAAFDPGYAVTDDAGENMIYAAFGSEIARCIIDWDEDWEDQEWTEIYDDLGAAWGIKAVGDTVLYVGDAYDEGGMVRTLNPTEEDEDDIEWNCVDYCLDDYEELQLRQITSGANGCPDSNVLWATNDEDAGCHEVWFYEDTLATQVILATPAEGTQIGDPEEVTLTWEALCDGWRYEVDLYRYCVECPDEEEEVDVDYVECEEDCDGCSDETCCLVVEDLAPGSTYYWSVRVVAIECEESGCYACVDDDDYGNYGDDVVPMLSKWSEEQTFVTEMTAVDWHYLCSPECGGDDIIITPNFSWEGVTDATSYEIQLATNEDFDPVIASGTSTVNAWLGAPELEYGTTYYWRVRTIKNGVTSDWATCIFTTMAEPAPEQFCCQDCGLCFDTRADLEAHWNATHAPVEPSTPFYIWVIIAIGALLAIAVIILIVRTRRTV
jgi:hypothetical protein